MTVSHIAEAVAPLKIKAIETAEVRTIEHLIRIKKLLTSHDFDLARVAPWPQVGSRNVYMAAKDRHNYFVSLTNYDELRTGVPKNRFISSHAKNHFVTWDDTAVDRHVAQAKEAAAISYDRYVTKLEKKIGDVIEAVLSPIGDVWQFSILTVTLPDGTKQSWKTQMILNHSSLGRLFNQWPTRLMK
jgi:hypothetical protein